ncbi:MAG TPA: type II toxin-antitoxin system VapC family toxin [Candidatus Methylomirabilis sp.]|nr:type II toxin-antitoxin system VapC family toxin [Candidatus Methylomirabilis sp.]
MTASVGVDTNVLAYLAQAASGIYDPAADPDAVLMPERVAAYRIFLHSACVAVTATVNEEIERTANPKERAELVGWKDLLPVEVLNAPADAIAQRARWFQRYHHELQDCQIVAEAEIGGLEVLLTFDRTLRRRLDGRSPTLRLRSPSEHWRELQIPRGQPPRWSPTPTNPIADATWWRWE